MNSVRGYGESMLSAKSGLSANAEINYDINFFKHKYIDGKKLYAFFDFGIIFPDNKANLPDDYQKEIYGCGAGIKFGLFKHFEANVICAFALNDHKYYATDKTSFLFVVNGRI
jgi:hemolysin activation/secretion protein